MSNNTGAIGNDGPMLREAWDKTRGGYNAGDPGVGSVDQLGADIHAIKDEFVLGTASGKRREALALNGISSMFNTYPEKVARWQFQPRGGDALIWVDSDAAINGLHEWLVKDGVNQIFPGTGREMKFFVQMLGAGDYTLRYYAFGG